MRLVIDGQRLTARRTGVGRCLESLLAGWSETGWPLDETWLVLRDRSGLARVPDVPGLRTIVTGERWPGLVWENVALRRLLRPDDVLFAPANLVPITWHGRTLLVLYDTLPWTVPGSFPWHVRLRFGWRYRLAARRATRIVTPSRATARDVERVHGIPPDRLSVVYPGPEPIFRPLARDAPEVAEARRAAGIGDAPYFLFVGKRSRRRNIGPLLDGFARLAGELPDHVLLFVGPDAPDGATPRNVTIAGHVDEPVLHGLLAGAIALMYPSDYEGFGLPVIEAMASGCPVVTLRNSALVESGGDAAYYPPSASPNDLARAMRELATDAHHRARHVADGLAWASLFDRRSFARGVGEEIRRVAHFGS